MKLKITVISFLLVCLICRADTNILELVWSQPPGYQSTLFTTTNLAGSWTPLSIDSNAPPAFVTATQSQSFFYVVVAPTNTIKYNYAGSDNPLSISAPAGATFVGTNEPVSFWMKISDDYSNGWVQGI